MAIELDDDTRKRAIRTIQWFFAERRDEDIGDLQARFVLDFFLEKLGPVVYNQAIRDAQAWLQDKVVDLDGELFEEEPPPLQRAADE